MRAYDYDDTIAFINKHKTKNPHKKLRRRVARKKMKQDKFYNGFYEFIEENRRRCKDGNSD